MLFNEKDQWVFRGLMPVLDFLQSLFLSPKNSVEGALKVLAASECNIWVHPRDQIRLPLVEDFIKQRSMTVLALPELDELLDAETVHVYPYTKTFDEVIQEPFCILHTSGSTGLPKPVEWYVPDPHFSVYVHFMLIQHQVTWAYWYNGRGAATPTDRWR
jgi:hypothetical protein